MRWIAALGRAVDVVALNEMNGNRSNILVHLANCAIRTGRVLHFDPDKLVFLNDPGANALVSQKMRLPWTLS